MLKKTLAVLSVAALAAGTVALPAAAASPTPVQIAGCSACKAKCGACKAKCGACKAKCGACKAKCGACKAKCGACKAKSN